VSSPLCEKMDYDTEMFQHEKHHRAARRSEKDAESAEDDAEKADFREAQIKLMQGNAKKKQRVNPQKYH